MSKKSLHKKPLPINPAKLLCTIIQQGNKITASWAKGVPQAAKVTMLNNLAFAEHEVLIRHKYFSQSNIIDPHTKEKILIPKKEDMPGA